MLSISFEEPVNGKRIPCECLAVSQFDLTHFHLRRSCTRIDPPNSFHKSITLYKGINKVEPPSLGVLRWTWWGHRHLPLGGAACRRTRTRDFFSAVDKQVGEKGKKVVYYV